MFTNNPMINWLKRNVLEQELPGKYRRNNYLKMALKLLVFSFVNLTLGIVMFVTYANIFKVVVPYKDDIVKVINLPTGKIFLYVELDFNQANLKYIKSINYDQLKGQTTDLDLSSTEPFNKIDGKIVYPAGEVSNSYFQDKFEIENLQIVQEGIVFKEDMKRIGITGYKPGQISIPETWTSETNKNSKPLNFEGNVSGLPVLNERFINWINLSLFQPTKKLWGFVDVEEKGEFVLKVESISDYKKRIVFTKNSWLGPKNYFLPVLFIVISIFCFTTALLMFWM